MINNLGSLCFLFSFFVFNGFYFIMLGMVAYCGVDGTAVRFQVIVTFCWRYTCNCQHLLHGTRTLYDQQIVKS